MSLPLTIITAVRDGAAFLEDMIESVRSQGIAVPHIIVDDGSGDETPVILAGYGAELSTITLDHSVGQAAALNHAVDSVESTHCLILDADDLMADGQIARVLDMLQSDSSIDLLFSGFREFASGDSASRWVIREESQIGYFSGGAVLRTELVRDLGGFSGDIRLGWFIDFALRARESGAQERTMNDVGLLRRVHGANMTIREKGNDSGYLAVARAAIARRRE
jgi:glycosyltransferase involved in cell wall biosynthesis